MEMRRVMVGKRIPLKGKEIWWRKYKVTFAEAFAGGSEVRRSR